MKTHGENNKNLCVYLYLVMGSTLMTMLLLVFLCLFNFLHISAWHLEEKTTLFENSHMEKYLTSCSGKKHSHMGKLEMLKGLNTSLAFFCRHSIKLNIKYFWIHTFHSNCIENPITPLVSRLRLSSRSLLLNSLAHKNPF